MSCRSGCTLVSNQLPGLCYKFHITIGKLVIDQSDETFGSGGLICASGNCVAILCLQGSNRFLFNGSRDSFSKYLNCRVTHMLQGYYQWSMTFLSVCPLLTFISRESRKKKNLSFLHMLLWKHFASGAAFGIRVQTNMCNSMTCMYRLHEKQDQIDV